MDFCGFRCTTPYSVKFGNIGNISCRISEIVNFSEKFDLAAGSPYAQANFWRKFSCELLCTCDAHIYIRLLTNHVSWVVHTTYTTNKETTMNQNIGIKDVAITELKGDAMVIITTTRVPWVPGWRESRRMIWDIVPDIGEEYNWGDYMMEHEHVIMNMHVPLDKVEEFLRRFKDGVDHLNRERPMPERIVDNHTPDIAKEVFGDLLLRRD